MKEKSKTLQKPYQVFILQTYSLLAAKIATYPCDTTKITILHVAPPGDQICNLHMFW